METDPNQNQNTQQSQQQAYQQQHHYMPTDNMSTFATLHMVKGILTLLFSFFFLAYIFLGIFVGNDISSHNAEMPFNPGNLIIGIGVIGFIITVVIGILTLLAAKYIKERRNYNFVFAIAIVNCISGVLGIVLGILTILDLNKPHVKAQFENK